MAFLRKIQFLWENEKRKKEKKMNSDTDKLRP
jgi:hypothetical protein